MTQSWNQRQFKVSGWEVHVGRAIASPSIFSVQGSKRCPSFLVHTTPHQELVGGSQTQAACPPHMPSWPGGFVQGTTCTSMSGSPATLGSGWCSGWEVSRGSLREEGHANHGTSSSLTWVIAPVSWLLSLASTSPLPIHPVPYSKSDLCKMQILCHLPV